MPELVIAVVGPTAAGKSDLALRLAHVLGGEVVNADSLQLYAGMDIGTAKLTLAERVGEPQCQVGLPGRGGPDDGDDQFRHDDQSVRDSSQEATR